MSVILTETAQNEHEHQYKHVYSIINRSFNLDIPTEITAIIVGGNFHQYYSLINNVFEKTASKILWSVINYEEVEEFSPKLPLQHGFLFLLFPRDVKDLLQNVENILDNLLLIKPLNHLTRFIVLVENTPNISSSKLAKGLFNVMWSTARITNVIISVFTLGNSTQNTFPNLTYEGKKNTSIASYTWFPYQHGNCQGPKNIHLLREFPYYNESEFTDIDFFPSKIPNDFQGCAMTVAPYGNHPYQMATKYVDKHGNVQFKDSGLGFGFLKQFAQRFNITLLILKPVESFGDNETVTFYSKVMNGESDFAVGALFIHFTSLTLIDFTIPILYDPIKIQTPCPKPIPRIERVMSIFTLTVWLSTMFVYVLISVVLWVSSKRTKIWESRSFRKLSQCFQNSWAILIGVAVYEIPKSTFLRYIFVLYVAFCLAISTVYQAFFITFLIEPGYGRPIETMEDLIEHDIKFGWPEIAQTIADTLDLPEIPRQLAVVCHNITMCTEHTMFKRNVTNLINHSYPYYIGLLNGVQYTSKVICFYKEDVMAAFIAIGTHKGHPILHKMNKMFRRLFELGFDLKSWSEIKHITKLKSFDKIHHEEGYFVFSLTHLATVFFLILYGYAISSIVFLFEILIGFYVRS